MRPRILVVDDEPIALEILNGIFAGEFDTNMASSGAEALLLAKSFKPDVIVLDAVMPEMDGWKTCSRLKSNRDTAHIKVIMISAHAIESEHHDAAKRAGADDFITKPLIHERLYSSVIHALGLS